MLHDRLVGVLCLGAATLAATWGGNDALHQAAAHAARGAAPAPTPTPSLPGLTSPDTGPAPAAEPSTTATAAPSSSTTTATAPGVPVHRRPDRGGPAALAQRALVAPTDLPPGFTMTAPAPPDDSDPGREPASNGAPAPTPAA